ncbi:site-specific DNA-methyltransferase [Xanthomonas sacchari]|uniref:site-specific DNA-methyltransferase n=1 Tax=Xanthomonas sp. SHU 308 TaxID=1591201 RepID=UPI0003776D72|nr:site-specific DNA-methyltransferase [Xanthomonas sp. SHU 308]
MEKLKMHSPNLTEDNIARIRELFPGCVTEARDEDGSVRLAVDFDQLRQELSASLVEGPQERYHLNWPGKREALLTANAPIAKTLRPVRSESVDFDTTKNLFIEGDNLDALKLLQETYLGKVKMIFIDPPYNTGNDFIYEDDFAEDAAGYLRRSNQVDGKGQRLVANTAFNGRFHSDWLSMIYARLKLARTLLRDDGVIFISIDDSEQYNLLSLCYEIFGADNFVATIIWQHSIQPKGYTDVFSVHHNYIFMFQKTDAFELHSLERTDEDNKAYSNPDNDPRGLWRTGDVRNALYRPNLRYEIKTPSGKTINPPENGWRWSKETLREKIACGEIVFRDDETRIIRKIYLDTLEGRAPETIWFGKDAGTTRDGAKELKEDFDGEAPFDTAKPTALIKRMAKIAGVKPDDLVLDFFAGSGTTGVACLNESLANFILVQLPETFDESKPHGKAAHKLGITTISELACRRLKAATSRLERGSGVGGFRVLKIDSSNMADVYYAPDTLDKANLDLFVDNIKPDRTAEDLLFQVMLDWGVDLALPIEKKAIQDKDVFFVDGNALAACFDAHGGVDEGFVKELATHRPLRVVFRDAGFKDSAVKINVEQIFKLLSPSTEVKSI